MSASSAESREYKLAEGLICQEGEIAGVIDTLDEVFLLGQLTAEGYVVNDDGEGSSHGTTSQEYLYFKEQGGSGALPVGIKLDITYTKHPPEGCTPGHDYQVGLTAIDSLGIKSTNHFRLLHDGRDGSAWIFVPDKNYENKHLKPGSWREMMMDELVLLNDILCELQGLHDKASNTADTKG